MSFAQKHDCLLVLPHAVGDFVPEGATLIQAFGGGPFEAGAEEHLVGHLALGIERTIEQDPAFAIRVMVDIANKALSAAVNDPTTAVQVIDHLGEILRVIGTTNLRQPPRLGEQRPGRVIMRARRWEDFLWLGTTEIRRYGAASMQVNRRLRAMLEELHDEVLPEHRAAVTDELARLDASVAASFRRFARSRPGEDRRSPGARRPELRGVGWAVYRYRIVFPTAPDQQLERSDTAMIEVEEPYEVGARITHGGKVWQVDEAPLPGAEPRRLRRRARLAGRRVRPPKLHRTLTRLLPRRGRAARTVAGVSAAARPGTGSRSTQAKKGDG